MDIIERLNMFAAAVGGDIKNLETTIGNKFELTTEQKETIVAAINSIHQVTNTLKDQTKELEKNAFTQEEKDALIKSLQSVTTVIKEHEEFLGDKTYLATTNKENLVEAINSLVDDLETVKTEKSHDIEGIKTRLDSAEENLQNLNQSISKIDENKNSIAKNLEEIKKNKESITKNLTEIEKNKEFITGTKTDILSNLEKIKNNNNNIESLKNTDKTHEASINSINKSIADLAAKTIDLQNKVGNTNVSSALATKLDTTTERHIKEGTYQLQNDGTVTLTKVDGAGTEKANEVVKITGVATKASVDTLTTEVNKKANIIDVNSKIEEEKTALKEEIDSAKEKAKEYEEGIKKFKELIGINPEIAKANEISINPFELLAKFIKNSLGEKTEDAEQNETIYCLFNNEKNIKDFIKDEQLDSIKKGIKFIQNNINKYISFNSIKSNDLILPQELNLNEEFKIEIYNVFGYYEKTYKFLPYLEYIKKDKDFNQLNNFIVYTNFVDEDHKLEQDDLRNKSRYIMFKIEEERVFTEEELEKLYTYSYYDKFCSKYKSSAKNNIIIVLNKTATKYFNPQKNIWEPISNLINFNLIEKNKERLLENLNNYFDSYIGSIKKYLNYDNYTFKEIYDYYDHRNIVKSSVSIKENNEEIINNIKKDRLKFDFNSIIIFNSSLTKLLNKVNFEWIQLPEEKITQIKNILINSEITYLKNNFSEFIQNIKNNFDLTKKDNKVLFLINENSEELNQLEEESEYSYYSTKERSLIFNKNFTKVFLRITGEWVTLDESNKQAVINAFEEKYINAFNNLERIFVTNDLSTNPNWSEEFPNHNETALYVVDKNNFTLDNSLDLSDFYNFKKVICDKNKESYYNILNKEWISLSFNIQEKINNAYLKQYNNFFDRYNNFIINNLNIDFNENPNIIEEFTDEGKYHNIIFTKEKNIKNAIKNNNETFEITKANNYKNIIINENSTKYYNAISKKWEDIPNEKIKNYLTKYTQFYTKKEEFLNSLKTVNFNSKYINNSYDEYKTRYNLNFDSESITKLKESEVVKMHGGLFNAIGMKYTFNARTDSFSPKILLLTSHESVHGVDINAMVFPNLKVFGVERDYSGNINNLITSENYINFYEDIVRLKIEDRYFSLDMNNEYLQKLLELYKA